jgi:hypothetical protein
MCVEPAIERNKMWGMLDAVQAARDQSLFREVNEKLRGTNAAFEAAGRDATFVCECANHDCTEQVPVPLVEYHAVRLVPTHFIVAPNSGHVFPNVERVAEQQDTYWVVEKYGDAGLAAIQLDPRRRQQDDVQGQNVSVEVLTARGGVRIPWESRQALLERIRENTETKMIVAAFEAVGTSRPVDLDDHGKTALLLILSTWLAEASVPEQLPPGIFELRTALLFEEYDRGKGP